MCFYGKNLYMYNMLKLLNLHKKLLNEIALKIV